MATRPKTLGILTGGGDCPGLNAVIRAVTKSACQADWGVLGILEGYAGLLENRCRPLDNAAVSNILTQGGTILGTSNRADPFAVPAGGKTVDKSALVLRRMKEWGLDCLVTVGGDGTQFIANRLAQKGAHIVGVPKTIDNDLQGTDLTFGFDTAVQNATEAIDKLHTTAQSHQRVMIVEVMGRYAGWLALHAGVAGGGDIILIPEIPFAIPRVVQAIKERRKAGKTYSIVVVAEGAKAKGGKMVVKRRVKDSPDPIRLGGVGAWLADRLRGKIQAEVRVTVLGHVLRGGVPTPADRVLASRYGAEAFSLIKEGEFGRMVALSQGQIVSVSLDKVASGLKLVPHDHTLIRVSRSLGTTFGD